MNWRAHLFFFIVCAVAFALLCVVGNGMYRQEPAPQSDYPNGAIFLYRKPLPEPLGHLLWIGRFVLLIGTVVATIWFLYRCVRTYRAGVRPGVCRACGYDIRATPHKCPECGTPVAS